MPFDALHLAGSCSHLGMGRDLRRKQMTRHEIETLPGYRVYVRGGSRGQMQDANREAGHPCYCASLWSGFCDCCTGIAGEERRKALLTEQTAFPGPSRKAFKVN